MIQLGILISLVAGPMLALWNGANDNFKGVATLLGSKTTSFRTALIWGTLTTFMGSLVAFYLAKDLLVSFSGKGLVPNEVLQLKSFAVSVSLGAALTVFLATRFGFPISTTHALVGSLIGAGYQASPVGVNLTELFSTFFLPLLSSPFISGLSVAIFYPSFFYLGKKFEINRVAENKTHKNVQEKSHYASGVKSFLNGAHFLSSGLVGFARGLNDTPKIAALFIAGTSLSHFNSILVVSISMAIGGILFSKKVAETMSFSITKMNQGQGLTSNLATSSVVILASLIGMPVSTTHVSCGALFGLGVMTKQADWSSISKIVFSWLITLPVATMIAYGIFTVLSFE